MGIGMGMGTGIEIDDALEVSSVVSPEGEPQPASTAMDETAQIDPSRRTFMGILLGCREPTARHPSRKDVTISAGAAAIARHSAWRAP
jgi:hypothetical protein